jgi:hypothetical protein
MTYGFGHLIMDGFGHNKESFLTFIKIVPEIGFISSRMKLEVKTFTIINPDFLNNQVVEQILS